VRTAVTPFDFSGEMVRVVADEHGEPWWFATDVCSVLDLPNVSQAVSRLADDERSTITSNEGGPDRLIVSEAGLYRLIFTSRKAEAETFRRWVTHEVLPAIRRTGSYGTSAVVAPFPEIGPAFLRQIAEAMEAKDQKIAELEPIAGKLLNADGDLSVADAAKALTRAGVKVGAGRLFTLLSSMHWIFRDKGDNRWRVYQTAIDGGWMSVLPQSHYHPKTGVLVLDPPQPRVTPKGLKRLLCEHGADVSTSVEIVESLTTAAVR
jgi:anti-repressor protein